jgi:hypothetical protein
LMGVRAGAGSTVPSGTEEAMGDVRSLRDVGEGWNFLMRISHKGRPNLDGSYPRHSS